jgi:hypothetical protein
MRATPSRVVVGLLGLLLSAGPLLATTAEAATRSCIVNLAGNVCLAQCIGDLQQGCGSDPACHQGVAAALQALASVPDETEACAAAISAALAACDCD